MYHFERTPLSVVVVVVVVDVDVDVAAGLIDDDSGSAMLLHPTIVEVCGGDLLVTPVASMD